MNDLSNLSVFNHHTFLYNDDDIEYIFKINNYKLMNKSFFNVNDNSFPCLFFHFKLSNEKKELITLRKIIENRHLYTCNLLKSFKVSEKTFIATAGMQSLTIYNKIENKENIIGIIDYNKKIQNKKYGNTNLIIQTYEYLKNYSSEYSILVFGYRTKDIINHIKNINRNIKIIEI